jgi:hypothetical protein
MLDGFKIYDADAHAMMTPEMWKDIPEEYTLRRPRAVRIVEDEGYRPWNTAWLIDGQMEPHPYGRGAQAANTPGMVLDELRSASNSKDAEFSVSVDSLTLRSPKSRLEDLDNLGIDLQFLFPSTLYAHLSSDPYFEAAMYRAHNRYMARQCTGFDARLKWAGLVPMLDTRQGCEALAELQKLGATAVVLFGTVGERLLSDASFTAIWDEISRTRLPVCIHMGMSYPPFAKLCQNFFDANLISKALPAQLAFVSIVGHNMLDRYPKLKIAFLEFGAEWIFYMCGRMDHYLKLNRSRMPVSKGLPRADVEDYLRSGRIFVAAEADDPMLVHEMSLLGEDHVLFSSDFPHGEGRENAMMEVIERKDLSEVQKRKILYENTVHFFGEP